MSEPSAMCDASSQRVRLSWVDSLRLIAVVGVVVQHACVTRWMSIAGIGWGTRALLGVVSGSVSCLMLVAGYASTQSPGFGLREPGYPLRRAQRLLLPYLAWTALYALLQTYAPYGQGIAPLAVWDLLQGTGVYVVLWFLPAMYYCSVIGWAIRSTRVRLFVACAALALYVGREALHVPAPHGWLEGPFGLVFFIAPWLGLYLLGQASAAIPAERLASARAGILLGAAGLACATAAALTSAMNYPAYPGATAMVVWASSSAAVAFGALLVRGRWPQLRLLPKLASVSLGIYLMHLPLLSLIGTLAPAGIVPVAVWIPTNAAVVLAIAGGVSLLIRRTPARMLVG